ncbi:MAG: SRPBCC family protein [Candidatus Limnocylindria bacterium]
MIIEQRITVDAPPDRVWEFLMDVPAVGNCVPGVEAITRQGGDRYSGVLRVRIGPISARLEGTMTLAERDRDGLRARMDAQGSDRLIGGAVSAKMTMRLEPRADGGTDLAVHTDAAVLGKLGQFGQAIIKRQADQLMAEFARNVSRALAAAST